MRAKNFLATVIGACGLAHSATADDITYLTQARMIEAEISFNNTVQTITAPGFGPFIEDLNLITTFPGPGGATLTNQARVGIDCQLDPNAIRVIGSLAGAGGLSVTGGPPSEEFGEAGTEIETTFRITTPTPFRMLASPRPSTRPGDRFQIKLEDLTRNIDLFELDETMPPQTVNFSATLAPGDYSLEFEAEMKVTGPEMLRDFFFSLALMPPDGCYPNCDASTTPPALNINDFVCFQTLFAQGNPQANCDQSTILPVLNVNDFACFLSNFAAGCN